MEQQKLPNATLILILGIFSIITCCCYGIIGIILAIIGLILASKSLKLYSLGEYSEASYSNVKIGRILCYVGIALNLIFIAYLAWIISNIGIEAMQNPELLQEKLNELMGK